MHPKTLALHRGQEPLDPVVLAKTIASSSYLVIVWEEHLGYLQFSSIQSENLRGG